MDFFDAYEEGLLQIAELMIEKGENDNHLNWALYYACKEGNLQIVELMIEKGAIYWNLGLFGACIGGHMGIAELMIEKGASYKYYYKQFNDYLLEKCIFKKFQKIQKIFITELPILNNDILSIICEYI